MPKEVQQAVSAGHLSRRIVQPFNILHQHIPSQDISIMALKQTKNMPPLTSSLVMSDMMDRYNLGLAGMFTLGLSAALPGQREQV